MHSAFFYFIFVWQSLFSHKIPTCENKVIASIGTSAMSTARFISSCVFSSSILFSQSGHLHFGVSSILFILLNPRFARSADAEFNRMNLIISFNKNKKRAVTRFRHLKYIIADN